MDYQKDTSLNDNTLSDQAQGGSPEGISHPARQGSLSEDSPYKSGQGSLSGDSPYRSGQGSLSKDSPYGSGQGSLSEDSPYRTEREAAHDALSPGDDGKKQTGGRTLATAVLAVLVVIALFLVVTIIRRPSVKRYDEIAPASSVQKDAASDDMNDNETVEDEKTEQEIEEEAIAEEEASAEEIAVEEAAPAEEEEDATAEEDEEQKGNRERFERASQLGPSDALTADDFVFYEGADNRYADFFGGMAISFEEPGGNDPDDEANSTVSARGISLQSTKEDVEKAYGTPAASGQVSDQSKFYYILHDFEGEYDESMKKAADWHLGFEYYEYYYESGCVAFDFDENGGVAAIAVDSNSRMFW